MEEWWGAKSHAGLGPSSRLTLHGVFAIQKLKGPHGGAEKFGSNFSTRKEGDMNRSDLVAKMAAGSKGSKAAAEKALNAFIGAVSGALKKGEKVSLVGFGTFSVTKRAARTGRNPRTGATIKIPAAKIPKFKPGKELKNSVR